MNILKRVGLTVILSLFTFFITVSNVVKAETNPFTSQTLVTVATDDAKEGKCGEGKCGEDKAKAKMKCGEGKCGESKGKTKKCGG